MFGQVFATWWPIFGAILLCAALPRVMQFLRDIVR